MVLTSVLISACQPPAEDPGEEGKETKKIVKCESSIGSLEIGKSKKVAVSCEVDAIYQGKKFSLAFDKDLVAVNFLDKKLKAALKRRIGFYKTS